MRASINAQYIHPYAGIRSEDDVSRVQVMVGRNLGREWSLCGRVKRVKSFMGRYTDVIQSWAVGCDGRPGSFPDHARPLPTMLTVT